MNVIRLNSILALGQHFLTSTLTNHTYQHPEDVRKKKVSKSSKTKSYSPNIRCKTIHEKEIFIGAN